jgi:hypothetical protein
MFMTIGIAAVLIFGKFLAGALIGASTAALIYRSRTTVRRVLRASFFAGTAFLFGAGLAGWADSHASFENGRRVEVAPWGEDLRFRNFIAENGLAISIALSAGVAAMINVGSHDRASGQDQLHPDR